MGRASRRIKRGLKRMDFPPLLRTAKKAKKLNPTPRVR